MVSAMLRSATAQTGLGVTWEMLQAPGLREDQLLELQRRWQSVDLLDGLERGLEGERCLGAAVLQRFRAENPSLPQEQRLGPISKTISKIAFHKCIGPLYLATVVDNDLLFGLRNVQSKVEMARALRGDRPLKDVLVSLDQVDAKFDRKFHSPLRFFYIISAISVPNFRPAFVTTTKNETERRLAVAAIALTRYQLRKGRPAPSLDTLVPEFLPGVPRDCMSGRPLRYQLRADGGFALYSVGMDGIDNGGDCSPAGAPLGFGLWEGRDAVWPASLHQKLAALAPQLEIPAVKGMGSYAADR